MRQGKLHRREDDRHPRQIGVRKGLQNIAAKISFFGRAADEENRQRDDERLPDRAARRRLVEFELQSAETGGDQNGK